MQTLRETHGGAYMYIIAIDKTLWAVPFMEAKRWGHMTSNMVESINSALKQDRDLSIIDLLNAIWNRCMGQRYARFQDAVQKLAVPGARYTNFALQLLTESMDHSQHRRVEAASETRGVVTSHSDKQYVVDLEARTCTCGRFEINDIPCGHAVSLILRLRKQPRDYIPKVFTLETYRWTYMRDMHPVDIQYLQILREGECYPPLFRRTRGRPKERRIRKGERKARGLQRGVQMAGALGDVPDNAPQRCTQCGNVGHNRTTCNEVYQLPIVYPVE